LFLQAANLQELWFSSDVSPRFKIQDDKTLKKDRMAAWACIRLDRLLSGYRMLRLLDAKGTVSNGTILVKIEKILS
jgi:phosphatidylinositol phospholipase C delta